MSDETNIESLAKDVAAIKKMLTDMKKGTDTRRRKDPNAPSRPLNAYFVFQKDARPKVKAELEKKLKNGEKAPNSAVNDELKKRWEDIKNNQPELYKKFVAVASAEKKRYEKEKSAYVAQKATEKTSDHEDDAGDADQASEEEVKEPKSKKEAPKKEATKPPAKTAGKTTTKKDAAKPASKAASKPAAKTETKKEATKPVKTSAKAEPKKSSGKSKKEPEPEPEAEEVPGEDSNLSEIASLDSEAFSDDDLLEDL